VLERERGDHKSNFCGIKVSIYFDGKSHSKAFTFYNKKTKTYLQGDERDPIRKLARDEETRLKKLRGQWLIKVGLEQFSSVKNNNKILKIHLGLPFAALCVERIQRPNSSQYFVFSMRGLGGFNIPLPKSYDDYKKQWKVLALKNANYCTYKTIPGAWKEIRPTKQLWLGYLNQLIEFTRLHNHNAYIIDGDGIRNPKHAGSHYVTGYPGLTFKVILVPRKIGGGKLAARINIMTPRGLRGPSGKPKTRSFQLYNYEELTKIWPHAIEAYCKICRVTKTSVMLKAIPSQADFRRAFQLGREQFKGRLTSNSNPSRRAPNKGNKKPLDSY